MKLRLIGIAAALAFAGSAYAQTSTAPTPWWWSRAGAKPPAKPWPGAWSKRRPSSRSVPSSAAARARWSSSP